jgi:hypothetical protein
VAATAALLADGLGLGLAALGMRPLGWLLLAAIVPPLVLAGMYARATQLGALHVVGLTSACLLLTSPAWVLVVVAVLGPGAET